MMAAAGPSPSSRLLEARGISIGWSRRGRKNVLSQDIDLDLARGELVSLVGPNGSGKSTLLRTLVGMQRCLEGSITLGGKPLERLAVEGRARWAASVFTDRFDAGWFSVYEIVAFGRYPYTDARNSLSEKDLAAVEGALRAVGLSAFAERRFAELSDGEKQKALIARALAQDSPLLVLDEPTAFLDAPARIEIFHLAKRLAGVEGKSVVLSTQDLDLALRYSDRIWLFDRAHRFASGGPESLALSGILGRAFDGPEVRFDPATGGFKATEAPESYSMAISSPDDLIYLWTARLADRLGFEPRRVDDGGMAAAIAAGGAAIAVRSREEGRVWELSFQGASRCHPGLEELADALKAIAPKGRQYL
jgi:iron complex transport system ATP-binding protein